MPRGASVRHAPVRPDFRLTGTQYLLASLCTSRSLLIQSPSICATTSVSCMRDRALVYTLVIV